MSLAAATRRAADRHPFVVAGLRAGVLNYTAAARYLDVDGEVDAVATALRRYADELPEYETAARSVRVSMRSDVAAEADTLLAVDDTRVESNDNGETAIVAVGEVDATCLATVISALSVADVAVQAAGVVEDRLVVVVPRLEGANALRTVEAALDVVPVDDPEE